MNRVKVFGRPGSDYRRKINGWMGNNRINQSHLAVNYGLQGAALERYAYTYPSILDMPVLNYQQAGNKYDQVLTVSGAGELTPVSWKGDERWPEIDRENIIIKPFYSLGGRDIRQYQAEDIIDYHNTYLQERITNRRYEIRVHAFAWIDSEKWVFQKRVHDGGEDVLAWNHHNGGRFITIEDPHDPLHNRIRESVKFIMKALGYQFGGADFIIQNPGERGAPLKHYFIEWNLAPGWTLENTENYYEESFLALQHVDMDIIQAMVDGIYPWDMEDNPIENDDEAGPRWEAADLQIPREQGNIQFIARENHPPIVDGVMQENADLLEELAEEAVEIIFCTTCGTSTLVVNDPARFCHACGANLTRLERREV